MLHDWIGIAFWIGRDRDAGGRPGAGRDGEQAGSATRLTGGSLGLPVAGSWRVRMGSPDGKFEAFEPLGQHADSPAKLRELGLELGDIAPWPLRRRQGAPRAAGGLRLIPLAVHLRAVRPLTPGLVTVSSLAWRLSGPGLITVSALAWRLSGSVGLPFTAGFGFEFLQLVTGHFTELVGLAFHACGLEAVGGLEDFVDAFLLSSDVAGLVGIGFLGKGGGTAERGGQQEIGRASCRERV